MKYSSEIKAEYVDHMGDELRVVNAARVSFSKESSNFDERDEKLIRYLATNNHWTPFSHAMVTLRETVPIFVARQRFKHMVGFTYNEESRRYVDEEPTFFIPEHWRERVANAKQGSGKPLEKQCYSMLEYKVAITVALDTYNRLLSQGVAPEMARMVLPQSTFTSYYVTGSLAAWARAYKLRIDEHAQKEIQDLAKLWNRIISPLFPVSWGYLTNLPVQESATTTVTVGPVRDVEEH